MKIGIIANYTPDAAIASIIMERAHRNEEITFVCGGHSKVSKHIQNLAGKVDILVLLGYPYTSKIRKELRDATSLFSAPAADSYIVFDASEETSAFANDPHVKYSPHSTSIAVCKFIRENMNDHDKYITPDIANMVTAISTYIKLDTKSHMFNKGYILSSLFYNLQMWDFKREFSRGLPKVFGPELKKTIRRQFNRRNNKIFSNTPILIGDNSVLYHDDEFIDDYAITIPGYNLFYIVRNDYLDKNCLSVSIRPSIALKDKYDMTKAFDEFYANILDPQSITRFFGSKTAFGMTFSSKINTEKMVDILTRFNTFLESKKID